MAIPFCKFLTEKCDIYVMIYVNVFCLLGCVVLLSACQTMPRNRANESPDEMISAMEKVTGAIAMPGGQKIDAQDLVRELRTDEEARTAIQSISEGLAPTSKRVIRYCPETGEHFGPGVNACPETGTPLIEIVEEY